MPDIMVYASTGVTYKNGTAVVYADKIGNTKTANARVEHNVCANQSGVLDTRNDDKTYYTT